MEKPSSLRTHLIASIPQLRHNDEKLLIFVDEGSMRSTAAAGLSFEYSYTLSIVLTDFAGSPVSVAIPLFAWIFVNQNELMANQNKHSESVRFEAEIIDSKKVDLRITLPLTERVIVKAQADGSLDVTYPGEPQLTPHLDSTPLQVFANGELIAEWTSADPVWYDIETPHPGPSNV